VKQLADSNNMAEEDTEHGQKLIDYAQQGDLQQV